MLHDRSLRKGRDRSLTIERDRVRTHGCHTCVGTDTTRKQDCNNHFGMSMTTIYIDKYVTLEL